MKGVPGVEPLIEQPLLGRIQRRFQELCSFRYYILMNRYIYSVNFYIYLSYNFLGKKVFLDLNLFRWIVKI